MSEPLWTPTDAQIEKANMSRFIDYVNAHWSTDIKDFHSLYAWSVASPSAFWPAVWQFCDIKASRRWDSVFEQGSEFLDSRWFRGATLNFSENLLKYHNEQNKTKAAIVFWGEDRVKRRLSYGELYRQVASVATYLNERGVEPGDRVAGFLPNLPETITAMLATTRVGGVWSSCSPDFGFNGVLDRFGQIMPKVLFTADGYYFKGKAIDSLETVRQLKQAIPSIEQVVVAPYLSADSDISRLDDAIVFGDVLNRPAEEAPPFAQLPFDHPLYVMYSSGTTGIPKCIVHSAGGTLIQHLKEHALHTNLCPGDVLFYFTTCGWMMWNWLVSGLASGATLALYDGSPFFPRPEVLLDFVDQEGITVFGTSAKYLSALEKAGIRPRHTHDLSSLRTILSTGSPLLPESFDYVYQEWGRDIQLASISGGTDIISCFALGNPVLPVYRGELQSRGLGMKVEVFNEAGQSVTQEKGELVCTAPFPSMPIYFWNDKGNEKYRAAYFERFPGLWAHGDYAELTAHDGLVIYGRSDAVLNPAGVRIGTAEIYRQAEKMPSVLESLAVGQAWQGDTRIILFVKSTEGTRLDEGLKQAIKKKIRDNTTARHVPAKVIQVPDIPRTLSGKIVELAVTQVIHGRPVKNTDALANPEALAYFENLAELKE